MISKILFPSLNLNKEKCKDFFYGKTIVITGASFGIGENIATILSRFDVYLILIARTENKLLEVQSLIKSNGSKCDIICCDLYSENEIDLLIKKLQLSYSKIDIFISNAGKSIYRNFAESRHRWQDISRTHAINYLSPVKIIQAIYPQIKLSKGLIVNVSAMNVLLLPAQNWAAYQSSKTAFDQWCRSNQFEWRNDGVKLKTIYLPLVKTRMIAPNVKYQKYPSMNVDQAAIRIINLLMSRSHYQKPWWSFLPQCASYFGRNLWDKIGGKY